MKDLKKEIIKKITFKVFDKETNSYVEEWKCFGDGINKDGVLCVPTYEKSLSPVSKQFEYHIQEELYTKEEVEKIRLEERKKTLEEVWGLINDKLDTMDINTQEPEINALLGINKKIDTAITRLSKLSQFNLMNKGNEKE